MFNDDTFLAKWLAGKLTQHELQQFQQSDEYDKYSRLLKGVDALKAPEFDEDASWRDLQDALKQQQRTALLVAMPTEEEIPARSGWRVFSKTALSVAAAAITIVVVSWFLLPAGEKIYQTGIGESLTLTLPDGSKVTLNAMSSLSFDAKAWKKGGRNVTLDGEALFHVSPGSTFTVQTDLGSVEVVGTRFDVRERGQKLFVQCFEGKVKVYPLQDDPILLQAGQDLLSSNGVLRTPKQVNSDKARWTEGSSEFDETPMLEVLEEIERQYPITILNKEEIANDTFSGAFVHNNVDSALYIVLKPYAFGFRMEADKVLIYKK